MEALGSNQQPKRIIGKYSVSKKLGKGGTAVSRLASTQSGQIFALKIFGLEDPTQKQKKINLARQEH